VPWRHPPVLRRGSAGLTTRCPPAAWRARRRSWLPGLAPCPAPRPACPRPWRRAHLACPRWPARPLLRRLRRPPRGGPRWRAPGGRAVAGPWVGAWGGRQGPELHAALVVVPGRCRAACPGRSWGRPRLASGRRERQGVRGGGAGARRRRPRRVAPGAGTTVRRSDGLALARELLVEAPRRRRRVLAEPRRVALAARGLLQVGAVQLPRAAWAGPSRAGAARLFEAAATQPRQALAGLVEAASWPAGTAWASPRPATSARSRPVALARQSEPLPPRPLQMASAGPRGVGWVEALVGWGAAGTPRASVAGRWAGSASPGVGMGARVVPRAGLVVARTPGWTPTGCRREQAARRPPARSCDLPGGR